MVGSSLQRSLKSPNWKKTKDSIPKNFTLNKGHVKFFYDKGSYLSNRYLELVEEMHRRNMKTDPLRIFKREQWPDELFNNWLPNINDLIIIRERIAEKISLKPDSYRWKNK